MIANIQYRHDGPTCQYQCMVHTLNTRLTDKVLGLVAYRLTLLACSTQVTQVRLTRPYDDRLACTDMKIKTDM